MGVHRDKPIGEIDSLEPQDENLIGVDAIWTFPICHWSQDKSRIGGDNCLSDISILDIRRSDW